MYKRSKQVRSTLAPHTNRDQWDKWSRSREWEKSKRYTRIVSS